jgi:hypothetical protein
MEKFNRDFRNSWILEGYKYVRCRRIDDDSIALKPFNEIDSNQDSRENNYFLEILEDEIGEMADNKIPLLNGFQFYVDDL